MTGHACDLNTGETKSKRAKEPAWIKSFCYGSPEYSVLWFPFPLLALQSQHCILSPSGLLAKLYAYVFRESTWRAGVEGHIYLNPPHMR